MSSVLSIKEMLDIMLDEIEPFSFDLLYYFRLSEMDVKSISFVYETDFGFLNASEHDYTHHVDDIDEYVRTIPPIVRLLSEQGARGYTPAKNKKKREKYDRR